MVEILVLITAAALIVHTLVCLAYFVSSIWEKEKRAGIFAMENQIEVNGTLRWKLDEQSCFEYWGKVGTGCNICMRVCPWSHASSLPHQLIKNLVSRNWMARRVFTLMDDIFYGNKPRAKAPPGWARYN